MVMLHRGCKMEYRVLTVSYVIDDEVYARLQKINEEYKKKGIDGSSEDLFSFIMTAGSFFDIDGKFKLHEWQLGLRESWK